MNLSKFKTYLKILFLPFLFLIVALYTLDDYGTNTDEPYHFYRGQAYFHYFLTGSRDYSNLPAYPRVNSDRCKLEIAPPDCTFSPPPVVDYSEYLEGGPKYEDVVNTLAPSDQVRRSFFQHDGTTVDQVLMMEDGHPPVGGILAAATNYIFYQNLKLVNDIESHHLVEVFLSFLVLVAISIFVYYHFGFLASAIAVLSISLYPLFFAESHFNIKDPVETSFFGLTIISFYFGIIKKNWKLIILSSIFAGLALGTKFNALFLPFIVGPWIVSYIFLNKISLIKYPKSIYFSVILLPIITLLVFYIMWPHLWPDPIGNIQKNIQFYKSSGLGSPNELKAFLFKGFSTFPLFWILTTTPIPLLILSLIGIVYSLKELVLKKNHVFILIFVWMIVPIARVSLPNFAIYGGVRHIMEFILPLGMLCGLGALGLMQSMKMMLKPKVGKYITYLMLIAFMSFVSWELIKIHPNQNVYFNQLIGGLSGARDKNVPYWGNSYGNAYYQGVLWLNKNAEPNARLGLPASTMANIPRIKLRSDIYFNNGHWSGPTRQGEYEMELTHNFPQKSWYSFAYYETYLNPVYELKVDDTTILKIWKNDLEHTRKGFEKEIPYKFSFHTKDASKIILDLNKEVKLTRITIDHSLSNCQKQKGGYVSLSSDGKLWNRESEPIDFPQVPPAVVGWDQDTFVFLFPAKQTRFIELNTDLTSPCLLKESKIEVLGLDG